MGGEGPGDPATRRYAVWEGADGNLALRLAPGVLGLDVDAYDDKAGAGTLGLAVDAWGPLPLTYRSSARPEPSGIYLFRVPEGLRWRGGVAKNVTSYFQQRGLQVVGNNVEPWADSATLALRHTPGRESNLQGGDLHNVMMWMIDKFSERTPASHQAIWDRRLAIGYRLPVSDDQASLYWCNAYPALVAFNKGIDTLEQPWLASACVEAAIALAEPDIPNQMAPLDVLRTLLW